MSAATERRVLERRALHEAGHAVVAMLLYGPDGPGSVERVQICSTKGTQQPNGLVEVGFVELAPFPTFNGDDLVRSMMFRLGGEAAQRVAGQRPNIIELMGDTEGLVRDARKYFAVYAPEPVIDLDAHIDDLCEDLLRRTNRLLKANWEMVQEVAALLADRGHLVASDLRAVTDAQRRRIDQPGPISSSRIATRRRQPDSPSLGATRSRVTSN